MTRYQKWRQAVFTYFADNYKLTLLESEIDDIECLILKHLEYLNARKLTCPPDGSEEDK